MKIVGIIPNVLRDTELEVTRVMVNGLKQAGFKVITNRAISELLGDMSCGVYEEELYKQCHMILVIGGDGTILGVAQKAAQYDVPILGINLGRLGFLADIESQDVESLLAQFATGDYTVEERMMLKCIVVDPTGKEHVYHALNDVNVTRGSCSRITEYELKVNGEWVDIYPADGIIVATPTGSTAYNLSAGGPIALPHISNMILTPICPHTIYSRSIILSSEDVVEIKTHNHDGTHLELTIDGQIKSAVTPMHHISVQKSEYQTKLIKLSHRNYFEILRKKIVERRI